MNDIKSTKLDLLKKKINEFFSKNKEAKSAIFELAVDDCAIRWKVERNKNALKIVEIKKPKKVLVEAPVGQVDAHDNDVLKARLAAAEQTLASQQQAAMPPPPPQPAPPAPGGVPMDPMSAAPLPPGAMPPMDMAPPPAMSPVVAPPMPPPQPPVEPTPLPPEAPPPEMAPEEPKQGDVNWDKVRDVIQKAIQKDPSGWQSMAGSTPQSAAQALQDPGAEPGLERPGTPAALSDPVQFPDMVTDTERPDKRGGRKLSAGVQMFTSLLIEQPPMQPASDMGQPAPVPETLPPEPPEEVPFKPGVSEESAMVRGLKGQTIKDVKLENDEQKLKLEFTLVTTKWPAVFEWERGGKLTFVMKNKRYVLQKRWD